MSNNKQSSVEYFKEQIVDIVEDYKDGIITLNEYIIHINSAFEQAKAMHKEERISDYYQGACDESDSHGSQSIVRVDAEQWYNETFGGDNDKKQNS